MYKKIHSEEQCPPRRKHLSVDTVNLVFIDRSDGTKAMHCVTTETIYLLTFLPSLYLPKVN